MSDGYGGWTPSSLPSPADPPPSYLPQESPSGVRELEIERRDFTARRSTKWLDWVALVLAVLLPPVGLVLAAVVLIVERTRRGWTTGVARAALGIAVALSVVVAAGGVVAGNYLAQQAAYDAIVSGSARYCAELKAHPEILSSTSFGWPAVDDTIPASIVDMQKYERVWSNLVRSAPAGVRNDTRLALSTVKSIVASVQTTRVLDDAGNRSRMTQVATGSSIAEWVANYCH